MPSPALNSIDDYEHFLWATIEAWSPEQRLALAAAMAERWLPVYEAFSAEEEWGDPPSLRRMLDAVWDHLRGPTLAPNDLARYRQQLHDSTPHMDDFDAYEALVACGILADALQCCATAENGAFVVRAALAGFETVEPDWPLDPEIQPRVWKQVAVRKELKKQFKLLEHIGAIARFDDETIKALRRRLTTPQLIGEVPARPDSTPGPASLTNQVAFEQYRRMVDSDLKSRAAGQPDLHGDPYILAIMLFAEWAARYTRRLDTIAGNYGQLADVQAQQALLARQRAHDAAETLLPDWDPTMRSVIDMCLQNNSAMGRLDAGSLEQPHGYGPSLRRLWAQAKRLGQPDLDAWQHILAWARHRPSAWEVEDRRKKQGLAYATPALGQHLARELAWTATGDVDHPWAARVDGVPWRVRLNDFPDDFMYSLVIDDAEVAGFHDWPETWQRG
jgi:uncharacterized protein YjaG (DUF416 family)